MEQESQSTVNSQPSTVEQKTPITVHGSQNSFLVILLSSLLIISCLIAGFFAWQTQKLVAEVTGYREQLKQVQESITNDPQPSSTPDPTASPSPEAIPSTTTSPEEIVACTMDAKICPDGSAVGRSGPKCEFEACPTPKN